MRRKQHGQHLPRSSTDVASTPHTSSISLKIQGLSARCVHPQISERRVLIHENWHPSTCLDDRLPIWCHAQAAHHCHLVAYWQYLLLVQQANLHETRAHLNKQINNVSIDTYRLLRQRSYHLSIVRTFSYDDCRALKHWKDNKQTGYRRPTMACNSVYEDVGTGCN